MITLLVTLFLLPVLLELGMLTLMGIVVLISELFKLPGKLVLAIRRLIFGY
jgi:hypothetical protein